MSSSIASSSLASTSRSPLRHRANPTHADEAVRNGAYLARPPTRRSRLDQTGKGKERQRKTLIPGLKIGSRGWVREGFRLFGEHCARNQVCRLSAIKMNVQLLKIQIRTLLIDCLVMTNLFYPALSIYLQKRFPPLHPPSAHTNRSSDSSSHARHSMYPSSRRKEHPLSLLSTPVLDTFFPYPPPLLPPVEWHEWWGCDPGQGEAWHLVDHARPAGEEEVRLMRVAWADVGVILDGDGWSGDMGWTERDFAVLDMVRATAESWEEGYRDTGEGCIRQLEGRDGVVDLSGLCYVLADGDVPGPAAGTTTTTGVLSGAGNLTQLSDGDSPYKSVGVVFRVPRASAASFDDRWTEALELAARGLEAEIFPDAEPLGRLNRRHLWHLSVSCSFLPVCALLKRQFHAQSGRGQDDGSDEDSSQKTPKRVYLLYLVLFAVLGYQLTDATKVHSRFGLAFTGIVQLCCSAVMSFSVLALLGWNGWGWGSGQGPSLPTYVLPFVIVVVGAENMSALVSYHIPAVHKQSLNCRQKLCFRCPLHTRCLCESV